MWKSWERCLHPPNDTTTASRQAIFIGRFRRTGADRGKVSHQVRCGAGELAQAASSNEAFSDPTAPFVLAVSNISDNHSVLLYSAYLPYS